MTMGKKAQGILGSLPILAVAFGRRQGIKVEIGGDVACTDGRVIHLPSLPLDCDEQLETKAFGYLYHEAGHIEFTDIAVFQQEMPAFTRNILNCIEDVRMEQERNLTYPGSAASLSKLLATLVAEGRLGTPERVPDAEPQDVLSLAVLTRLRHEVLDQPCGEIAAVWWDRLKTLLGDAATVKLEALLGTVDQLDVTADALALARRVATLIEEAAKEPPPEEKPSPDDNSNSGQSDQQGSSGGDQGAKQGDSAAGQGNQQGDQGGNQTCQQGAGGDGHGRDEGTAATQGPSAQPDREALKRALDAAAGDFSPTDLGDIAGKSLSGEARQAVEKEVSAGNADAVVRSQLKVTQSRACGPGQLTDVQAQSKQLRARLAAVMEAQARVKLVHRRQGTRLDGCVVHRIFTGNGRVFAHREDKRKVNTAVKLLLDASTSMRGPKIEVARKATLACALGLEQTPGCKVAAASFPDIEILKKFEETGRNTGARFAIDPKGSTPMGEAMIWAATELGLRREARKILIVTTDGQPNNTELVKKLIAAYSRSGIEVIGVGIGAEGQYVKDLFNVSVCIDSVDQLATSLFGVLNQRLRRVA
jgi:cobalamin biosynthesis protein CobT